MKKVIGVVISILLASVVIFVLYLAKNENNKSIANKPNISIHVEGENAFLNEKDILERLQFRKLYEYGFEIDKINIAKIETFIRTMDEIKEVKVFKNIGNSWVINIELRKPIARIYSTAKNSCYIDDQGYAINQSNFNTARVLIVSGEINENFKNTSVKEIINNDSLKSIRKLDDIYRISNYVCNDVFFNSLIGQIYLEKNGDFLLIPIVGSQTILFGSALSDEEVAEKFNRLKVFYKEGMPYEGWAKYNTIIVKYDGQIVGRK